ncbi:MAG: formate dehydrogenase [Syntrophobacteraceae bacterium CG2_30_61_12]|nr:MAG: formate dehydrogenase [Syntrophobacteraceae bacterium CG2_30_61_12]PIU31450.1 MAG: formate dehydrogenase [Syntrophobacteraceae bacterium CG07_land_8_20_14_0_80_61_8]
MADKSFFIDTTRCTACRGCQVACKQWNQLPAVPTHNWGSFQNPPDLTPNNYKLVRFSEVVTDGKLKWLFFPDQCRHCLEPPCKDAAEGYVEGAVVRDEATGAVIFTEKSKQLTDAAFKEVREACPYDIPRRNEATKIMSKCTMCIERVQNGLVPACVKACCTGTLNFGDRTAMLELAQKRLAEVKGKGHPKAQLLDADTVRTIFLVTEEPKQYHPHAVARVEPGISRKLALRKMFRPAIGLLGGAALLGCLTDSTAKE